MKAKQPTPPTTSPSSLRSQSSRRKTLWIAAALFLLGYLLVLIAVYRRLGYKTISSNRSADTAHACAWKDEESRGVAVTSNITTELDTTAVASRGRRGTIPWRKFQGALGSGTMMLAQVIREASDPFISYSSSTQLQRYESPGESASQLIPQPSSPNTTTTTTQQEPPEETTETTTSSTTIKRHNNPELVQTYRQLFALGFSTSPDLDNETLSLLQQFKDRVLAHIPDLHERAAKVNWGGTSVPWWLPPLPSGEAVDEFEGGRLLYYYFRVMYRYMTDPHNLLAHKIYFPFRLCKKHGCAAEDAIAHTLEYREKYQPWRVTPGMREENKHGFCYLRGFSPPSADHDGRHSLVWFRLGRHKVQEHYTYFRVMVHTLDRAIAEALHESNYRVGKFNVLIDGTDFEFQKVPNLSQFKHFLAMTQDHLENRVGVLVLTNVSRTVELVVNLVKPLITKEVSAKIHILSHDPDKRAAQLEALIQHEYIPDWLGGSDTYRFDVDDYYAVDEEHQWTNEESREFIETMPYHAV